MTAMQTTHSLNPQNTYSPQELALEIKAFISGIDQTQGRKLSVRDHARCAVRLLCTVPACRGAVLEHLRGVYGEYVSGFLQDLETEGDHEGGSSMDSNLEDVIKEIHTVLSEFIRLNPKAWAPLVSTWAVDLLGQLSSKHAGRRAAPHSSSLNELLQLWMSCSATRSLMEIYSLCLAAMLAWCPDACVDALLDTSVQHSPHFDWVVAHIGSAFPDTIISRVLACGLKDFCAHGYPTGGDVTSSLQGARASPSPALMTMDKSNRVPKIGSVVGILGHLASRHSDSIKKELFRMFQDSVSPPSQPSSSAPSGTSGWESSPHFRRATVPFLLQLIALSPTLLGAVSAELVDSLRPPVLLQLHAQMQSLPREELENLLGLAVHLISQFPAGGAKILRFLCDTATPSSVIISGPSPSPHEGVRESCDRLLQMLLLHLHKLVYNRPEGDEPYAHSSSSSTPSSARVIPFLEELQSHVADLCGETLRLERKRHLWLHQLLCLLSVYGGPSVATEALCHLLTLGRNPEELALASQLHAPLSSSIPGLITAAVARCVAQIHTQNLSSRELSQLLNNLATAVQSQEDDRKGSSSVAIVSAQASMAVQVGAAVSNHLHDFCPLLLHGDHAVSRAAARLLSCSQLPRTASPAHILVIARAAVAHFFLGLRQRGLGGLRDGGRGGNEAVAYSTKLLSRLAAYSPLTLKAVLQQLVEGALLKGHADLFGGQPSSDDATVSPSPVPDLGPSLLDINCKFGTTVNFSGSVWSVFHAGVIGKGLKPPTTSPQLDPEKVTQNLQTLLAVMVECCSVSVVGAGSSNGSGMTSANSSRFKQGTGLDEPAPINAEAAKAVAVALVENVCSEVTNGELAWPPEEHAKTTVERDIHIRRAFEANPVLFHLLRVVAAGRPALCYCSVVLRGLLATLLAHWDSSREISVMDSPWHLQASCLLISCMGEGQLLPPVLSNVHELFPHLTPFEVRLLLLGIWEYMRGNSPMPQKFTFSAEKGIFYRDFSRDGDVTRYMAPIHSVLHKNIDQLGHLCWRFQV